MEIKTIKKILKKERTKTTFFAEPHIGSRYFYHVLDMQIKQITTIKKNKKQHSFNQGAKKF